VQASTHVPPSSQEVCQRVEKTLFLGRLLLASCFLPSLQAGLEADRKPNFPRCVLDSFLFRADFSFASCSLPRPCTSCQPVLGSFLLSHLGSRAVCTLSQSKPEKCMHTHMHRLHSQYLYTHPTTLKTQTRNLGPPLVKSRAGEILFCSPN
jgi:hypothetical protein